MEKDIFPVIKLPRGVVVKFLLIQLWKHPGTLGYVGRLRQRARGAARALCLLLLRGRRSDPAHVPGHPPRRARPSGATLLTAPSTTPTTLCVTPGELGGGALSVPSSSVQRSPTPS